MKASHTLFRIAGLLLASFAVMGTLWAQTVQINPATLTVPRGGTVSLDVNVSGVTNLLASHVKVTFDNTKLQYTGATAGPFIPASGFFGQSLNGNQVTVDQSVLANPPAAGSGTLFTITFTALDAVSASDVALSVDLRDPANTNIPAGTTGSQVTINNPVPQVSGIVPTVKTSGDPTFDLAVNGANFVPTSVVWFKGVARTTVYGSASSLTATIPAGDIVLAGFVPVTVVNPAPGGGTSVEVVNLQVVPGPAASIALVSGNNQSAAINTPLANSFVVLVTDAGGNPVANTGVTFAISNTPASAGGQSLNTTTTTTDANGHASSTLTVGSKVGNYTVTATSAGLSGSPVSFTGTATTGPAFAIAKTTGDNQSSMINTALANPFVVLVTDAGGNPVQNASVTFGISTFPTGATGQILSTLTTTTDANGNGSSTLTVGNKVGNYTVAAASAGLSGSPVTFTATATTGAAATISLTSGDAQSGMINTVLANPFVVTVTDIGGNPVSGTNVTFGVLSSPFGSSGQNLSALTVPTDVNGQASSTLTLGNKVGAYTVNASSGTLTNSPVAFHATASTGLAATIAVASGNNQSAVINSALVNPFVVLVTDAGGNPVSGVTVGFALGTTPGSATGQAVSVPSMVTDVAGHASTTLTVGNKVGNYIVNATAGSLSGSPVAFTGTAITGPAVTLALTSGDGQSAPINTALANPFVVTVTDAGGNPVLGTAVTFAVATTPPSATGQVLSTLSGNTDASGNASSILTLGNKVGNYTVTASSLGLTPGSVTFTGIATPGALDHFAIAPIATQTAGTTFSIALTAQDIGNNTVIVFAGTVAIGINTGSIAPLMSGTFAAGLLTQDVTITGSGTGRTITVNDLAGHVGISNAFDVLTVPSIFISADPMVAAALPVFPSTSMSVTPYDPYDWSFLGTPIVSAYIVPEPGMTFNSSSVEVVLDPAVLQFAGVNFGASGIAGTPNGIVGTGQTYPHAESFNQNFGPNVVDVLASRTDGSDFPVISAGDYIARVDFHLLKPGYSPLGVSSPSFQRTPSHAVQVVGQPGAVKAYLGDVASASGPAGDGKIDFQDLSAWSLSYWSGVPGYAGGLDNYKVKYDIGPTADGSVFTLPAVDAKVDFEDLVIFSIAYGLSSSHQLPKAAPPVKDPLLVSLGQPVVNGNETRIGVMLAGAVSDVRAMRLEVKGSFGAFLGAENGALLQEYNTPVALMSRTTEGHVFVDLAVMGLNAHGLNRQGEVAVLRFQGTPYVQLIRNDARTSGNAALNVVKIKGAGEAAPTEYGLKQNYPNPFNPTTTIEYEVPATGDVTLEVYNMLGQKVATLVQEVKDAGFYRVQWNGQDQNQRPVASGMFFYRLQAGRFSQVKKMLMLK